MNVILNKGQKFSHAFELNYLAQEGNIYIMDNHLAAFWCWSRELDPIKSYTLMHIDRHNDLNDALVKEAFHLYKNEKFKSMPIEKAVALRVNDDQMLMWNNFIELYNVFNPYTLKNFEFVTPVKLPTKYRHLKNIPLKSWINKEFTVQELFDQQNRKAQPKVINLDIDVFFVERSGKHKKILTDNELKSFAEKIRPLIDRAALVTIALSPECCGGWENSISMYNSLNKYLKLSRNPLSI
ncbi:hypothetical protein AY601_1763 [Pedobacter cryoconitis]|uniref:Uncharacterized protein n=1 Tax=Pedobacter cryoconitis TaxID=188932 RepID=A0A127VBD9_9SPHI|nr:hypothetical protein [Pedobacter cryoconitis]AMP98676.1 hypothetical protein AY601_1763 [Pedobacter cryoconitis]